MKKLLTLTFIAALAGGCTLDRQSKNSNAMVELTRADMKNSAQAEKTGKIHVPNRETIVMIGATADDLGDFTASEDIASYEETKNGLGYSRMFSASSSDGIWATVYTYHGGYSSLRDGLDSKEMKKMYPESVAAIKAEEGKTYSGIKKLEEKDVTVKGSPDSIPFKKYAFESKLMTDGKIGSDKVVTEQYLAVYAGSFVQARISYYPDRVPDGKDKTASFMSALVQKMNRAKTVMARYFPDDR